MIKKNIRIKTKLLIIQALILCLHINIVWALNKLSSSPVRKGGSRIVKEGAQQILNMQQYAGASKQVFEKLSQQSYQSFSNTKEIAPSSNPEIFRSPRYVKLEKSNPETYENLLEENAFRFWDMLRDDYNKKDKLIVDMDFIKLKKGHQDTSSEEPNTKSIVNSHALDKYPQEKVYELDFDTLKPQWLLEFASSKFGGDAPVAYTHLINQKENYINMILNHLEEANVIPSLRRKALDDVFGWRYLEVQKLKNNLRNASLNETEKKVFFKELSKKINIKEILDVIEGKISSVSLLTNDFAKNTLKICLEVAQEFNMPPLITFFQEMINVNNQSLQKINDLKMQLVTQSKKELRIREALNKMFDEAIAVAKKGNLTINDLNKPAKSYEQLQNAYLYNVLPAAYKKDYIKAMQYMNEIKQALRDKYDNSENTFLKNIPMRTYKNHEQEILNIIINDKNISSEMLEELKNYFEDSKSKEYINNMIEWVNEKQEA